MTASDLKSFDRVADVYDETRGLPLHVAASIAGGLERAFREAAAEPRIVEPGIGTGRMAVPLAERGLRIMGLDIAPKMLAVLRGKRGDIDVALAEVSRPPLRPASFDGALFVHILHLVPDAEATVRATLALVRPGGVVVHAGDDHDTGVRKEADAIVVGAVKDLVGVDVWGWNRHELAVQAFQRVLAEAGAEAEGRTLARWNGQTSGRKILERLARRDYSASWQIPEDAVPAIVERVTPELESLLGGLDREVEYERTFSATIARLG
jgi:SAM-dependent methyltransferase